MNKKNEIVFLLALSALFYTSCDYVSNAVPSTPSSSTATTTSGVVMRNILIEDYTGHQCGNCPAAARELHRLDSINPGRIVPLAVHAGYYATVTSATAVPSYTTNFNTATGTDYDNFFGNSAAGNPNGLVNRLGYNTSGFIEQWSGWATTVASFLPDTAMFDISVTNTYNSSTNKLTADVKCTATKAVNGTYFIVVLLSEDGIVAEQIDYAANPAYTTNYVFNHVLRGAINSSWGDTVLSAGTMNKGDAFHKTYSNFQLASNWNASKCNVVVYVYDRDPLSAHYYEVMQAVLKKVQ